MSPSRPTAQGSKICVLGLALPQSRALPGRSSPASPPGDRQLRCRHWQRQQLLPGLAHRQWSNIPLTCTGHEPTERNAASDGQQGPKEQDNAQTYLTASSQQEQSTWIVTNSQSRQVTQTPRMSPRALPRLRDIPGFRKPRRTVWRAPERRPRRVSQVLDPRPVFNPQTRGCAGSKLWLSGTGTAAGTLPPNAADSGTSTRASAAQAAPRQSCASRPTASAPPRLPGTASSTDTSSLRQRQLPLPLLRHSLTALLTD